MTNEISTLLIMAIVGVALIVFGNYKRNERNKLLSSGIKTEGIIFRIEQITNFKDSMYYPVVRYTTLEKEWITEQYLIGSTFSWYQPGDKVAIIYDVNNNKKFIIDNTSTSLLGPVLMIAGGVIILLTMTQYFFHPFAIH